jgi:hypothetical protein
VCLFIGLGDAYSGDSGSNRAQYSCCLLLQYGRCPRHDKLLSNPQILDIVRLPDCSSKVPDSAAQVIHRTPTTRRIAQLPTYTRVCGVLFGDDTWMVMTPACEP